jgi:hypothetical protein
MSGIKPKRDISRKLQVQMFYRDQWLCHLCGKPVIFAPAMKYLQMYLREVGFSDLAYWRYAYDRNGAPLLDELAAVIDHVNPLAAGGAGDLQNLRTACNRCNIRKNNSDPRKWALEHPVKPIKARHGEPEAWDGFTSLFLHYAPRYPSSLARSEKEWLGLLRARKA